MKNILSALAIGMIAAPAAAVTVDLSNGTFDTVNRSWYFDDIAIVGGQNVNLSVTSSPSLISANDSRNSDFDVNRFQANLQAPTAGYATTFTFNFLTDANAAIVVNNAEIGVFDIDYRNLEVVRAFNPVSFTTTVNSEVTTNVIGSTVEVIGTDNSNVVNPTNFANLTSAQQDASVDFNFGNTSSFKIEAEVLADPANRGGRNYYFGNVEFTDPTITTPVAPIPVPPAIAFMLWSLGGLAFLGRFRRNRA